MPQPDLHRPRPAPWHRQDGSDVVILGGGPAGTATALSLRAHAPSLSVTLIEASHYEKPRIGETLPPPAKRMLEHLDIWEAFQTQQHRAAYGTATTWGTPSVYENDFLYTIRSVGWHLDRTRFDAMLAEQAARHGVRVCYDTRVEHVEQARPASEGSAQPSVHLWHLQLSNGKSVHSQFVVDATGRQASFARRHGAGTNTLDRLAGFAQFFTEPEGQESNDPRTLIESFANGWWYTAGLPDGRRIAACMTDMDIARRLHLREATAWFQLLAETSQIKKALGRATPCGSLMIQATESRVLEPVAGEGWLAVGDAASVFDPLSSQGIVKALRSGVFASYAIADWLTQDDDCGLQRYRRYIQEEFASYTKIRAKYYAQEQRWPDSVFWQRRLEESLPLSAQRKKGTGK